MKFTEAVSSHRQHLRAARRAERTLEWYEEQFTTFEHWRRAHSLPDELPSAETIEEFLADEHMTKSPSTVNARFRALRALFFFLERRRRITHDENPIHLIEAPSVPVEARRFVTMEDLDLMLATTKEPGWLNVRDRLIMHILFYSGLRVSELCALTISDFDRSGLAILVRSGKGSKARLVPCPEETITLFIRYLFERPQHSEHLLLASDGYDGVTGPLKREGVRQMLIRRCAAALIYPAFSPHAFRHGFAMWLLNAGARITTVSTAMGHSDPTVTHKIYAHTTTTTVRREYDEALERSRRT